MRICDACGSENAERARFCASCGRLLSVAVPSAAVPSADADTDIVKPGQPRSRQPSQPDVHHDRAGGSSQDQRVASAALSARSVPVRPMGEAVLKLLVRNSGSVVESFRVVVLGAAAEWTQVAPVALNLMPGTEGEAVIRFRPPLSPALHAGPIPFTVDVVSEAQQRVVAREAGAVELAAVREMETAVAPQTSRASRVAWYELAVENRGNVPLEVAISGTEVDGEADVRVAPGTMPVAPGEKGVALVRAAAKRTFWLGSSERRQLRLVVSAGEAPPQTVLATFMQNALIPSWFPKVAGAALAVALSVALVGAATAPRALPPSGQPAGVASVEPEATETPDSAGLPVSPTINVLPFPSGYGPGDGARQSPAAGTGEGGETPALPPGQPDLTVESLTIEPASPVKGQTATAAVVVRNLGATPAGAFTVAWKPDGTTPITKSLQGLAAEGTVHVIFSHAYSSASTWNSVAEADADETIPEANEENNEFMRAVAVSAAPPERVCLDDVTIREADFDVATECLIQPGDRIAFTAAGEIWPGYVFMGGTGPQGYDGGAGNDYPLPGARPFSLLGKIETYFIVGTGMDDYIAAARGQLTLRINDNVPGNGSGAFTCRVEVWREP